LTPRFSLGAQSPGYSGAKAAPLWLRLNVFQILVSNLPADSIQFGRGSADPVIGRTFDYLNWSISHEPTAAK
jgi:hypothetical protein